MFSPVCFLSLSLLCVGGGLLFVTKAGPGPRLSVCPAGDVVQVPFEPTARGLRDLVHGGGECTSFDRLDRRGVQEIVRLLPSFFKIPPTRRTAFRPSNTTQETGWPRVKGSGEVRRPFSRPRAAGLDPPSFHADPPDSRIA